MILKVQALDLPRRQESVRAHLAQNEEVAVTELVRQLHQGSSARTTAALGTMNSMHLNCRVLQGSRCARGPGCREARGIYRVMIRYVDRQPARYSVVEGAHAEPRAGRRPVGVVSIGALIRLAKAASM